MKVIWTDAVAWVAIVVVALLLALATPRSTGVLGRLPVEVGLGLDQRQEMVGALDGRVLAVVTFHKDQRAVAEGWVQGLGLHKNPSLPWLRMPVLNDPKDEAERAAAQERLLARYQAEHERAKLMPVFTDRAAFVRAAGAAGVHEVIVLVVNRNGEVLARVVGSFDENKASIVRDTLLMDL
ncbi:MAG: hypothetical protein LH632_12495 [Rhodoferax sp.]|nr:hypothetical protein [Rhodoferax sp.]